MVIRESPRTHFIITSNLFRDIKSDQNAANTLPGTSILKKLQVRYLDRHVVNVQAEGDSLVKSQLRLSGPIDIHCLL